MTKFVKNLPELIVWEVETNIPEQILELSKGDLILAMAPLKMIIELNYFSGFPRTKTSFHASWASDPCIVWEDMVNK